THWVGGSDQIGIFSPEAKATSDGTPEANPAKNLAFTAQNSAKSSGFNGTMFWGTGDHHFYAYYPRNSGFTGERTAEPISLPWEQTQSGAGNTAHIGALDFMVATPLIVTPTGAVNFTFNHVFTMIEFQIVGSGSLTQVSLSGAYPLACEGSVDLTQDPDINFYNITERNHQ
ncbi:MAG TPA: fimbrillin family protein, partial [Bacteroidales bacterium]|nr:fimbrillin family protein [Bacteroidales bacterium]